MQESDFIVIGAGIGGTSCAYWLAKHHRVTVLEMEDRSGYHTTGRSVAMYTEAYGPRVIRALAIASSRFLKHPPSEFASVPLCKQSGFMFIARDDQLDSLYNALMATKELSPNITEISVQDALERVPVLRSGYVAGAFLDTGTLALDVDAIHQGYMRGLKAHGGHIVTNAEAQSFEYKAGKWRVSTGQGEYAAPVVINAAGAWADRVAERIGARTVGLEPKRRTVIAFPLPEKYNGGEWPVTFDTDEEFYFKVDAGIILASPADETVVPAQDVQPEELDIAVTVDRLQKATTLKIDRITRKWAGLRSFVADHVPVVGYAPDVDGFFWCAGQGGYGIETSASMGQASAALASGGDLPTHILSLGVNESDLSPQRLWKDD